MKSVFQDNYKSYKKNIDTLIASYDTKGEQLKDARNKLKIFDLDHFKVNIKSFKIPNIFNQIVYRFLRKGKAQRSFEYAKKLLDMGIGTPNPIAYYERKTLLLFKKSYYVSEQLTYDFTYREVNNDPYFPNRVEVLNAFVRFTFELHQKGIHFLDHSPGNTLIKKTVTGYDFFLVDLNRMKFEPMSYEKGVKNFERLSKHKDVVELMSKEYAKCVNKPEEEVFELMLNYTNAFRTKIRRKKRLKSKIKK
ncbi:MAG: Kdo domain containing protein [Flavobacteriaceae bacterium]|nr:Kdo domain containing protein [Flavobacteriaceae bacterium]